MLLLDNSSVALLLIRIQILQTSIVILFCNYPSLLLISAAPSLNPSLFRPQNVILVDHPFPFSDFSFIKESQQKSIIKSIYPIYFYYMSNRTPYINPFPNNSTLPDFMSNTNPEILYEGLKRLSEETDMFPTSFTYLLEHESRSVRELKNKLKVDKNKIDEDLYVFKNQIFNMLDDLRLSLHANLDKIYTNFLQKYSTFKAQLQQIINLKNRVAIESNHLNHSRDILNLSRQKYSSNGHIRENNATISEIQIGNRELKLFQTAQFISQIQKYKIPPLLKLQKQILAITKYDSGFYRTEELCYILNQKKNRFACELADIYTGSVQKFIMDLGSIVPKTDQQVLDGLRDMNERVQQFTPTIARQPTSNSIIRNGRIGPPISGQIAKSQQSVRLQWIQKLGIYVENKIMLNGEQPLCGLHLNNQFIFGCKNGTLCVKSQQGMHITSSKNHKTNICCLAIIKLKNQTVLTSGSDHGCNSVIVWETNTWRPIDRFDNHKAAVSCIIDLKDESHALSAGYDKTVNVYDLQAGKLHFSLGQVSPIVGGVINKSGTRVIAISLNKSLIVWHVVRNEGRVESMFLQRKIDMESLGCSITASNLASQLIFVGGKDGKLRIFNIEKGILEESIICCQSHLIDILLVERESKPNRPLVLAWQFKSPSILVINTSNKIIMGQNWPGFVQFCCGVGPKCFFFKNGSQIGIISHNPESPDLTLCRLQQSK